MAQRNHRNAASRPSIYQTVTDRILSSLKAGLILTCPIFRAGIKVSVAQLLPSSSSRRRGVEP